MKLGEHSRNPATGRIHKERADSKIGNLKKEYPILSRFNSNMQLGTLEKKLNAPSLSQILKKLRKKG